MTKITAFDKINDIEKKHMLNCFEATNIHYKKDTTILSNMLNTTVVGIIENGTANIIRYNYDGTRTFIEQLNHGDVFGAFSNTISEDLYVISKEDCDVIMFDYSKLINRCKKNCPYHNQLIDNMLQILNNKLKNYNQRIEILTKKTIREKLLSYFKLISKQNLNSKIITIPYSLTDLADYLCIDRSAMMREIKNLKDDNLIESKGRKIYLNF